MDRGTNTPERLLGRVIAGKIEIQALLGGGAMGSVFRAHHRGLDKPVAVKVMSGFEGFDAIRTSRFVREAQAAARFDHPNTVQILDFGEDGEDRLLYLVMEYLEGKDLHRIMRGRGRMEGQKLSEIMVQALAALAAAHTQGVVHRDIKPANIMVVRRHDDDGNPIDYVKVCDFGLAKMLHVDSTISYDEKHAATIVGTPAYMAPEQAVGEQLDGRTDVYACGIVMYEMLTGAVPFDAETPMATLMQHLSQPPLPPSRLAPEIDPRLEAIVLWALEKDRGARCPNARELRRALLELDWKRPAGPPVFDLGLDPPRVPVPQQVLVSDLLDTDTLRDASSLLDSTPGELLRDSAILGPAQGAADLSYGSDNAESLPLDAILGPAESEAVGGSGQSGSMESVIESLVAEAVEDVVGPLKLAHEAEDDGALEGLDPRKHGAAVSDRAQYMWKHYGIMFEPYRGPHPFWVRDHNHEVLGPLHYKEMLGVLRQEGATGKGEEVALSGDGTRWMGAHGFVKLSGQETLLVPSGHARGASRGPSRGAHVEALERTSLTSLFARIAREQPTGRYYFHCEGPDRGEDIELHLLRGKPTFVYTSEVTLEVPNLLVEKNLITAQMLPQFLHMVLDEEKAIEQIVGRETGIDIVPYRAVFMRRRLQYLFSWKRRGVFYFDGNALPASLSPFAGSVLALLPEVVYHSMNQDELNSAIWPFLNLAPDRSERFNTALGEMGLTPSQRAIVRKFGKPKTIGASIKCDPPEEKMHLAMAYILLETDLLLRPL